MNKKKFYFYTLILILCQLLQNNLSAALVAENYPPVSWEKIPDCMRANIYDYLSVCDIVSVYRTSKDHRKSLENVLMDHPPHQKSSQVMGADMQFPIIPNALENFLKRVLIKKSIDQKWANTIIEEALEEFTTLENLTHHLPNLPIDFINKFLKDTYEKFKESPLFLNNTSRDLVWEFRESLWDRESNIMLWALSNNEDTLGLYVMSPCYNIKESSNKNNTFILPFRVEHYENFNKIKFDTLTFGKPESNRSIYFYIPKIFKTFQNITICDIYLTDYQKMPPLDNLPFLKTIETTLDIKNLIEMLPKIFMETKKVSVLKSVRVKILNNETDANQFIEGFRCILEDLEKLLKKGVLSNELDRRIDMILDFRVACPYQSFLSTIKEFCENKVVISFKHSYKSMFYMLSEMLSARKNIPCVFEGWAFNCNLKDMNN